MPQRGTEHAVTAAFSPLHLELLEQRAPRVVGAPRGRSPPVVLLMLTAGSDVKVSYWLFVFVQAMAYFEQLKESQDAWEACAEALAKGIYR